MGYEEQKRRKTKLLLDKQRQFWTKVDFGKSSKYKDLQKKELEILEDLGEHILKEEKFRRTTILKWINEMINGEDILSFDHASSSSTENHNNFAKLFVKESSVEVVMSSDASLISFLNRFSIKENLLNNPKKSGYSFHGESGWLKKAFEAINCFKSTDPLFNFEAILTELVEILKQDMNKNREGPENREEHLIYIPSSFYCIKDKFDPLFNQICNPPSTTVSAMSLIDANQGCGNIYA